MRENYEKFNSYSHWFGWISPVQTWFRWKNYYHGASKNGTDFLGTSLFQVSRCLPSTSLNVRASWKFSVILRPEEGIVRILCWYHGLHSAPKGHAYLNRHLQLWRYTINRKDTSKCRWLKAISAGLKLTYVLWLNVKHAFRPLGREDSVSLSEWLLIALIIATSLCSYALMYGCTYVYIDW